MLNGTILAAVLVLTIGMANRVSDKSTLRRHLRQKRLAFPSGSVEKQSQAIHQQLINLLIWTSARRIGCYLAMPGEVMTEALIETAWSHHQTVCVPVIQPESNLLLFSDIYNFSDCLPGPFSLRQPRRLVPVAPQEIDLMIIPGLAFDRQGHRLGMGKGFYDRYLKNFTGGRLAPVFDWQLINQVPVTSHDQRVNIIVTPDEIIEI